jgi:flagellar motility protein MotE (MotC chaperone)
MIDYEKLRALYRALLECNEGIQKLEAESTRLVKAINEMERKPVEEE